MSLFRNPIPAFLVQDRNTNAHQGNQNNCENECFQQLMKFAD
jgi:hypothetical protein